MEELKHTKGAFSIFGVDETLVTLNEQIIFDGTDYFFDYEEAKEMAAFICEAGQVANETGLTPRQLLEQRNELLEALEGIFKTVKENDKQLWLSMPEWYSIDKVESILSKIKPQ